MLNSSGSTIEVNKITIQHNKACSKEDLHQCLKQVFINESSVIKSSYINANRNFEDKIKFSQDPEDKVDNRKNDKEREGSNKLVRFATPIIVRAFEIPIMTEEEKKNCFYSLEELYQFFIHRLDPEITSSLSSSSALSYKTNVAAVTFDLNVKIKILPELSEEDRKALYYSCDELYDFIDSLSKESLSIEDDSDVWEQNEKKEIERRKRKEILASAHFNSKFRIVKDKYKDKINSTVDVGEETNEHTTCLQNIWKNILAKKKIENEANGAGTSNECFVLQNLSKMVFMRRRSMEVLDDKEKQELLEEQRDIALMLSSMDDSFCDGVTEEHYYDRVQNNNLSATSILSNLSTCSSEDSYFIQDKWRIKNIFRNRKIERERELELDLTI